MNKKLLMKRKNNKKERFITWLSKPKKTKKTIYEEIEETIAERKRILPEWEKLFREEDVAMTKDIHLQLKETISEFKKAMKQHEGFFISNQNKRAA